ncbi:hypothetical protein B296_00012279 [Ensete ventricosum]|uniref:Uncharacterized protein n=1 Tax=Ensete ventricosum TaxID=4639 RepID=A0A426ZGD0_ENSVE|nr:hypothetical protein B296_00012279 [Ensete ventricosum]
MPELCISANPMPKLHLMTNPMPKLHLMASPIPELRLTVRIMLELCLAASPIPKLCCSTSPMPELCCSASPVSELHLAASPMPELRLTTGPIPELCLTVSLMPKLCCSTSLVPESHISAHPKPESRLTVGHEPEWKDPHTSRVANPTKESIRALPQTLLQGTQGMPLRRGDNDRANYGTTPKVAITLVSMWHLGLTQSNKSLPGHPGLYGTTSHGTQSLENARTDAVGYETLLVGHAVHDLIA